MKVQVIMSDEQVARIDEYAKKMSVSRSALCSMLIGQGIMGFDKSFELATQLVEKLGDEELAKQVLEKLAK